MVGRSDMYISNMPREPLLMVSEITHRVVNEYTSAICSMQNVAARTNSAEARVTLEEAIGKLCSYADAHRALSSPKPSRNMLLSSYLEGVCTALVKTWPKACNLSVTFVDHPVILDSDVCWRIGLIVSELLTNSVRHAFDQNSGHILVATKTVRGAIQCVVRDDGTKGKSGALGRGSWIVDCIASEMGAQVEREFGPNGTQVTITVPAGAKYMDFMGELEPSTSKAVSA